MKIIFLSRRFYPQIGGVENHILEISRFLLRKGLEITVITENDPKKLSKKAIENFDGINVVRINTGENNRLKKFKIWGELYKHKNLFRDADIIHCHDVFFWYLPFRFMFPLKKVYTTFHGYETKYPPEKKAILVRKISEKLSYGNICIGDYIKKWYYTKPNYVSYGGVSHTKNTDLKALSNSSELKIVFIGRLENDIGIKTYLRSLEMLKKNKIKFDFRAYGEGALAKAAKKYGRVSSFTKNIYSVVESADIIFASSYLIMLQALAAKKIVIAAYENVLKEDYLRRSPFLNYVYICKNSNETFKVIKSIHDAPWKNESMIEKGYSWAKEQTWEKVADTYLKLWKI